MTQKRNYTFKLNALTQRTADLIASGVSQREAADKLGISRNTITAWRQHPEYKKLIEKSLKDLRHRILTTGAAVKENRIRARQQRLNAIIRGLTARGGDPKRGGVSWDESGLFVRQEKSLIGLRGKRKLIEEISLDTGTLAAMLALEEAIAIDKGDWKQKADKGGETEQHELSDEIRGALRGFTREEIAKAIERSRAKRDA